MSPEEKRERLLEAASAVLQHADDTQLSTVCLNKALFYLDLVSIRDFGKPLTHASFVALEQGPVVAHYKKRLIKELENSGIAKQDEQGNSKPIQLCAPPQKFRYITPGMLPSLKKIAQKFSKISSRKASDISHDNVGWKRAYRDGLGSNSPALPINLFVAMQQIAGTDPWMMEPLTQSETDSVSAADFEEGQQW